MPRVVPGFVLFALALAIVLGLRFISQGQDAVPLSEARGGAKIDEFSLPDQLGARHSLGDWQGKQAVVIVFLGTECPLAKLYAHRLVELAAQFEPKGVQFVAVNSNQQDTLREIAHFATVHKIEFPILKDSAHEVANRFGVTRTPAAFVLDAERAIRYRGRIDDQYGVGYSRASAASRYLADALDEVLSNRPVTTPATEAVGCYVGRVQREAGQGDVTYSNQIARLVQQHCLRCHREGQIAPFSMITFADVTAWAETMREVMNEGRMPPWHANPAHGEFANDCHMADAEKKLFHQWIENGMPEGDRRDLPKPVEFAANWQIPTPDVVHRMPRPFTVPAKGVVPYQYFYLDTKFEEDVWIRGAEIRPGNPSVVHHAFVFFLPPGQDKPRAEDPLFNALAGFAPGAPASLWPDGYARFVPAGSRLAFQMHYTPNGSEQTDQSEVGIVFAEPKSISKEVKMGIAVNTNFRIPPGAADFRVPAGYRFTQDTRIHALVPHMHYRGKSFRFTAQYPDGRQEILLDVPRYDFNWQNAYLLKEAKLMPKGTQILCDGAFDNSAANLVNPDPTAEVRWGDQSWEEMMLGSFVTSLPETAVRGEFPKVTHVRGEQFDVTFRYQPGVEQRNAKLVYLAGTFNNWNGTAVKMDGPDEGGGFQKTIRLKPGQYEYKFVINGNDWIHDPDNPDQYGPFTNSVVRVRQVGKESGQSGR
ncbi:MAG: redoxin domain-containing protein [Pirellulales bacterium]